MSSLLAGILTAAIDYFAPERPQQQPLLAVARSTSLEQRLGEACHSPTASIAHLDPPAMRRELDATKHELAHSRADNMRLEERCKMLEKSLKETRDLLRIREADLDRLRRERERDRALGERRRSDPPSTPAVAGSPPSTWGRYSSSLDTRMTAADLARNLPRNHSQSDDLSPGAAYRISARTPSPSHASSSSVTTTTTNSDVYSTQQLLLDEQRAQARSAETFLTRTDNWSGAQVLQAVHDINSQILQFAASTTETCTFGNPPSQQARHPYPQALQDTTARIGPHMTRILATRDHSQDPLLVQLALQGCLSLCIARALSSFCIGFPSKSDAVLGQIYSHMHVNEPQPTSAKWRALTHQHIHAIYPTLTDYSISELSDTILRWSADIFVISNCRSFSSPSSHSPSSSPPTSFSPSTSPHRHLRHSASTSTISTSTPQSLLAHLRTAYTDQVKRISTAVLRLARVTREDVISTSFEVAIADPTAEFDPQDMGDAFAEYGESRGRVLGTLELGLRCLTRVHHVQDVDEAESGLSPKTALRGLANGTNKANSKAIIKDDEGISEHRLLLQPKVVLESVLDVLDR